MGLPNVFMFSGQGSQFYNMGRELYHHHPRFKFWMDHCDEILHALMPHSIIGEIYQDLPRDQPFDQIQYTNPALLCIEYSLAQVLLELDIQPEYVLGYSLGEVSAAIVSGALPLVEGLRFAVEFADLVQSKTPSARMLAIIESVDIMEQYPEMFDHCWLTGQNFENNFVVAGSSENISTLKNRLFQKNIIFQKLPVNFGFHTELMNPIEEVFKNLVNSIKFSPPQIQIISSCLAGAIVSIGDQHYWEVIRYPVRFYKTVRSLLKDGDYNFIDVGPSGSLSTFVKYILSSESKGRNYEVINQFGQDLHTFEKFISDIRSKHSPYGKDPHDKRTQ